MEVMDTTLRDGEQTPGVNYTPDEKLAIAQALLQCGVNAIEIASAHISNGEAHAVRRITTWAEAHGLLDRIEILGFVDGTKSVDWIASNGGRVLNLLAKGSEQHCRIQLNKSPSEHFQDIARTARYADQCDYGLAVFNSLAALRAGAILDQPAVQLVAEKLDIRLRELAVKTKAVSAFRANESRLKSGLATV